MSLKKYAVTAAVLLLIMCLCPMAAMGTEKTEKSAKDGMPVISYSAEDKAEYIAVMSSETGEVSEIGMREYLIGCVAAEMPANYHPEALKAQAVASYSYAKRISEKSAELISDSPLTHQGYVSRQARIEKWGDSFEENEAKISAAVDAVYGCRLTYDGETALAVYHSISSGNTQSAQSLWGEEIPYLQSVTSDGDRLSPDFAEEKTFSFEEFAEKLGITVNGDAAEWVESCETENGYVVRAVICGKEFSGAQLRDALELRSNSFEIDCSAEKITVSCKGHGHGVGMSQYGADYMARQGSSWDGILAHYYPDAEITLPE